MEGHSRQRNQHVQSLKQERTSCRKNKELSTSERPEQEMKQGARWTPHNQEYLITYRKWVSWALGSLFEI